MILERVDWRTVLASVAASALLLLVTLAVLVFGVMPHYALQMGMTRQPLSIELPPSLPVQVLLREAINARLDGAVELRVPIDQRLPMRIDDPLQLTIELNADIPMNFDVVINDRVLVDTEIQTRVMGIPMTLPIKGSLPLNMVVPINQIVPLSFKAPIIANLSKPFSIHLTTVLDTAVELKEDFSIPITEALDTDIQMRPDTPIQVHVKASELAVPLDSLRLRRKTDQSPAD